MTIQQGANPEQLRALGRQFTIKSSSIKNVQSSIDQLAARLPQVWAGKDAEEFLQQWTRQHRPAFAQLAAALGENARTLAANAEAQERTSAELAGGSGTDGTGTTGTGTAGAPGSGPGGTDSDNTAWIPDWLEYSPFFGGWDAYNAIKAFPNIRFGLTDLYLAYKGLDTLADSDALAVQFRNAFKVSSDLFDGSFADIAKMSGLAESSRWMTALDVGGKGLGVLGVGIDTFQAVDSFSDGEYGDGAYSLVKAGLGAGSFLPPPAGTACMVASGALALYDNVPVIHDTVNAIGSGITDAAEGAWDGAKDFFGF
ncbi:WXG100 family type VII secretion target [Sinomonas halotolerans]|uniref:WXG100 family type VII secretion target n=1 Tax=Sinomonas halotolerans TaxID=1644133 RepID=A0ABU9WYK0_9MICC